MAPAEVIRTSGVFGSTLDWKMMSPFSAHAAPRPVAASISVVAAPPAIGMVLRPEDAKKLSEAPSGEKNGLSAFSVPASSVASS